MGSSKTEMPTQDIAMGAACAEALIRDVEMASPTSEVQHTRLPHVRSIIRPLRPLPVRSVSRPLLIPIPIVPVPSPDPVSPSPAPTSVPVPVPIPRSPWRWKMLRLVLILGRWRTTLPRSFG
uniref:N/A n=1 Tax=Ganoderma boninense TaxID=34458 RepID=A0A5K1K542_9APHY|nr:N/A [Ganoderma boninense]